MPLQHINDRDAAAHAAARQPRGHGGLARRLAAAIPDLVAADDVHRRFPRRDGGRVRGIAGLRQGTVRAGGVFPYSFEPGTPATRLDGHLPEEVKQERRDRLMETQQQVAFAWSRSRSVRKLDVIVDGPDPEVPNHVLARGHADAPDIDCPGARQGQGLAAGDFVRVKITAADGYDLVARAIRPRKVRHGHHDIRHRPPVFNLPNQLTGGAFRAGPGVVLADPGSLAVGHRRLRRGRTTDWLDGYLARKQGLISTLGRNLDPLVDKVLMCGAYIFLLPGARSPAWLLPWMVTVVVARELIITGLRSSWRTVEHASERTGSAKSRWGCNAPPSLPFSYL